MKVNKTEANTKYLCEYVLFKDDCYKVTSIEDSRDTNCYTTGIVIYDKRNNKYSLSRVRYPQDIYKNGNIDIPFTWLGVISIKRENEGFKIQLLCNLDSTFDYIDVVTNVNNVDETEKNKLVKEWYVDYITHVQ